jgi:acetoin utilization deacetylase AcuC-like enzyme
MPREIDRRIFIAGLSGAVAASACGTRAEDASVVKSEKSRTGLIADAAYKDHLTSEGHPEQPARYDAVVGALKKAGIDEKLLKLDSRAATDDEILGCHTAEYLATAKKDIAGGRKQLSTGDTSISAKSLDTALLAAGGVLQAVDAVVAGKVSNAFCVVRPPGHHATPSRGMGFCVFNNIAVAARYAQKKHKLGKVLIVDWDVHHGNGTQDVFYEDDSVFFFSTHQSPWYPGTGKPEETGAGKGLGATLNCPFPAGAGRAEIVGAFKDKLLPAAQKFKPDLVLISAGFDSRVEDPLGRFTLTDDDFAELTKLMLAIAKDHAGGRLVSVLEGGYNLEGLANAAAAHVTALM